MVSSLVYHCSYLHLPKSFYCSLTILKIFWGYLVKTNFFTPNDGLGIKRMYDINEVLIAKLGLTIQILTVFGCKWSKESTF
jgi:hypothetical protein